MDNKYNLSADSYTRYSDESDILNDEKKHLLNVIFSFQNELNQTQTLLNEQTEHLNGQILSLNEELTSTKDVVMELENELDQLKENESNILFFEDEEKLTTNQRPNAFQLTQQLHDDNTFVNKEFVELNGEINDVVEGKLIEIIKPHILQKKLKLSLASINDFKSVKKQKNIHKTTAIGTQSILKKLTKSVKKNTQKQTNTNVKPQIKIPQIKTPIKKNSKLNVASKKFSKAVLFEPADLESELQDALNQITNLEKQLTDAVASATKKQAEAKKQITNMAGNVEDLNNRIIFWQQYTDDAKGKYDLLDTYYQEERTRAVNLSTELNTSSAQITELENKVSELVNQNMTDAKKVVALEAELENLNVEFMCSQKQHDNDLIKICRLERELENLKVKYIFLKKYCDELKHIVHHSDNNICLNNTNNHYDIKKTNCFDDSPKASCLDDSDNKHHNISHEDSHENSHEDSHESHNETHNPMINTHISTNISNLPTKLNKAQLPLGPFGLSSTLNGPFGLSSTLNGPFGLSSTLNGPFGLSSTLDEQLNSLNVVGSPNRILAKSSISLGGIDMNPIDNKNMHDYVGLTNDESVHSIEHDDDDLTNVKEFLSNKLHSKTKECELYKQELINFNALKTKLENVSDSNVFKLSELNEIIENQLSKNKTLKTKNKEQSKIITELKHDIKNNNKKHRSCLNDLLKEIENLKKDTLKYY
jgi:hypothetical protein